MPGHGFKICATGNTAILILLSLLEGLSGREESWQSYDFLRPREHSADYGQPGNYVAGANIAGFVKVVNAMLDQGLV